MCGWGILSLQSYQGKQKKTKTKKKQIKSTFLRAKALQGCQIEIIVIV